MSTSSGSGVSGAAPDGTPTSESAIDSDLVSRIANEFYADTPPREPESAVPKSDPVRGRDVTEEAASLTDVPNVPENALGAQGAASPHGVADPAYYFLEHPETPESPSGTPNTPMAPAPTDAMHPESSMDPLSAQGGASQSGASVGPAAAGVQEWTPDELGDVPLVAGYVPMPAADEPPGDAPRATPSELPAPASPDAARPEPDFDPARLQALLAPMFEGVPNLYGRPEAGQPATPDMDVPTHAIPTLGQTGVAAPQEGDPPPTPGAPTLEKAPEGAGALPPIDFGGMPEGMPAFDLAGLGIPAGVAAPTAPPASEDRGPDEELYFLPSAQVLDAEVPEVERTSDEGFSAEGLRRDFPILHQKVHGKPLIWMDNAATTQKPQAVIDRMSHFYEHDYSNIHRGAHTLAARATDAYEDAREKVRRFIGAGSADELIWVRGTTEGINLIAQTWGRKYIGGGDEIILSQLEHHANIVPWQMLAREKGAVLRVVPVTDEGEVIMEEYARLLNPKTKLVGIGQVSNALGSVQPVHEMIAAAHRHGVPVVVDAAQSVPHMRVDVQEMDADFFVFSGHKMYGPSGVGVVYGKMQHLEDMPPWQGGGNMIQSVTFDHTTYAAPPAKFEAGTPTITDAVGLGAAVDYIDRIGIDNINRHEHSLTEYAMERLQEVPRIRLIGTAPGKVSVLSFVIEGTRVEDVARYLDREGIAVRAGHHCAMPTMQRFGVTGTVRPSVALYNTHDEVDVLVEALKRYRST